MTPTPPPQTPDIVALVCASGPDQGKRIALSAQDVILGRSPQAGLLSGDPDANEQHVAVAWRDGAVRFRTLGEAKVFVDASEHTEGTLAPGQQLRVGRSFWQLATITVTPGGEIDTVFEKMSGRFSTMVGVERLEGFDAKGMFSAVGHKRSDEDVEDYFIVGTRTTTPPLGAVDTSWPKPWLFARAFAFALVVYLGFYFSFQQWLNPNLLPGLILVGSFGTPLALLLFFWEMNVRRNVSLYQVIKLFLAGGVLSLITSLIFFQFLGPALGWLSHSAAGIIEETGKLIALLLVTGKVTKYRWTLNGLLLGATIGAGFAAFESAGYALKQIFDYGLPRGIYEMLDVIRLRALLAPGMHIAWTALVGAALWKVKGDQPFRFDMLQDPRFLRAFLIAMALHMLWNSPLSGKVPFYGLNIGLTVVAWFFIIHYVNDGLQQVRQAQAEASPAPVAEPEAPATAPA